MKVYAINGSPRKKWNTSTILTKVLEGMESVNPTIESEIINVYDLKFKGCISCFECKRIGSSNYGKCALQDDLGKIMPNILTADALIFGTPIYFGDITGMFRCFLERLFFPNFSYDKQYSSIAPKKIVTAFIYTMNYPKADMEKHEYPKRLSLMEKFASHIFGYKTSKLYVCDTLQFKDYKKYKMEVFSEEQKKLSRIEHFPIDCMEARQLGISIAEKIQQKK